MKNLKLLYFLTLCGLFLYMATGPAQASSVGGGGVQIDNTGWGYGVQVGNPVYDPAPNWVGSFTPTARFGLDVSCGVSPCSGTVDFGFIVYNPALITISLNGWSNDPNATGTVAFYDGEPNGETIHDWTVDGGALLMNSFSVRVPGSDGWLGGEFTFNLAANSELRVPNAESLDFTTTAPEPGSALLLGVGIAFVGFLRRKVHG
jgi:PEP-CTERM motif